MTLGRPILGLTAGALPALAVMAQAREAKSATNDVASNHRQRIVQAI
jgi:hypothetical protein